MFDDKKRHEQYQQNANMFNQNLQKQIDFNDRYGQGNNYHNQLKQRANTDFTANSGMGANNPFLNIGGRQYKGYSYTPVTRPQGGFWDRLYGLANQAMAERVNSANTRLHNNLTSEQALWDREQTKWDKELDYKYYQSAVDQQKAYDDRALRQDEFNFEQNKWANDFNYQQQRDSIGDDWNALKYNLEAQKLMQEQDYKERVLQKDRANNYYKNIASDLYNNQEVEDYQTQKLLADYYTKTGALPSKLDDGYDLRGSYSGIDNTRLKDPEYLKELQKNGFTFYDNGIILDPYGNRIM